MTAQITYDSTKFEELLLYVAERSVGDPNFGKTKLNKLLFYIDFLSYGILGKPVTGATYQRRPRGPVPKEIAAARSELTARGDADVRCVDRFGYTQERLHALRPANMALFSSAEKQLIDNIIDALWDENGSSASELSHREPGWRIAKERETIPYQAVFIGTRSMTEDDVRRGQEIYAEVMAGAA
jgi:hypothetical protein